MNKRFNYTTVNLIAAWPVLVVFMVIFTACEKNRFEKMEKSFENEISAHGWRWMSYFRNGNDVLDFYKDSVFYCNEIYFTFYPIEERKSSGELIVTLKGVQTYSNSSTIYGWWDRDIQTNDTFMSMNFTDWTPIDTTLPYKIYFASVIWNAGYVKDSLLELHYNHDSVSLKLAFKAV